LVLWDFPPAQTAGQGETRTRNTRN